ncbi:MAG: MFS transporter [Armatimonadota bacterium]
MKANLWIILVISLLFGVSTGVYEFVLPLFLRARNISYESLGLIFAIAGLAMVLARIYMGGLADRLGRKVLYGWALAVCGLVTGLTPLFPAQVMQAILKTLRETAALTRETLYPVVLYEERQHGFLNLIGKFRGLEFLLQGGGTLLAGLLIAATAQPLAGYRLSLYIAGGAMLAGALLWAGLFTERFRPAPQQVISLRALFSIDLHPNLLLLAVSGIIFTFGVQISHSFYLPLFFTERFGAPAALVSIIMVLHRLTIGLPMLIVGHLPLKNLRAWYIGALLMEGVTMSASALIPHFWTSAGVFLLHDFIGAGIWSPIQATLIQRYSRDATRGLEVGKVLAWSSIGSIIGPLAAGTLAAKSTVLPFFASGLVMALAIIPLWWLNLRDQTHSPAAQPAIEETAEA